MKRRPSSRWRSRWTLCLLASGTLAFGCALMSSNRFAPPGGGTCRAGARNVPREIETLRKRMARSPAPARATLHRDLAMLYVDHENPAPDYALALKELELYAGSDEQGRSSRQVQNWLAVLQRLDLLRRERVALRMKIGEEERKLEEARREREEAAKTAENLARENAELADRVKRLRKENQETKETIEKLKALDIEIEGLRRKIRR